MNIMKNKTKSRGTHRFFLVCCTLLLLFSCNVFAQTIDVRGNVLDNLGEPIIGANVVVQGTSVGTITDINGEFVLSSIPSNAVVEVSFIGYVTQAIEVKGKTSLKVTLQEDNFPYSFYKISVFPYSVLKKAINTLKKTSIL